MIKFVVPVKTRNPLNGSQGRTRGAVLGQAARRRKERDAAVFCFKAERTVLVADRVTVKLTRIAPRKLDGDGLQAALKSVRDGIAACLGVNDGSDAVTWDYAQRRGRVREYAVEVEIT